MRNIFRSITEYFQSAKPIPAGVYHYQTPEDAPGQYRLHLRVDESGSGLLIVNASTVLHLNQTATEHVYHLVQNTPAPEAAKIISRKYQIEFHDARLDFIDIQRKIEALINIPDLDPVTFFDFSRREPYSGAVRAPYRLDCALTYQLPQNSPPELAPQKRVDAELNTQQWTQIIDKAWDAGIPQIIFTGGEPTLREDLVDLIAHAEENGQVTGLLTEGLKLQDTSFFESLLLSGLDHLMFVLNPDLKDSWSALQAVLREDLFTTVHLTIKPGIIGHLSRILNHLTSLDVNAVSLSVSDPGDNQLNQALETARTQIADAKIPLKWDLPVPYSSHNPVQIELQNDQEQPEGAGKAWLYIEPDGDILPSQGINQILGNFLTDSWDEIWNKAGQLHTSS